MEEGAGEGQGLLIPHNVNSVPEVVSGDLLVLQSPQLLDSLPVCITAKERMLATHSSCSEDSGSLGSAFT